MITAKDLNKAVGSIANYLFLIICLFFPGMVLLNQIFGIGLFNNTPATLFQFILFLAWAIGLSSLYIIPLPFFVLWFPFKPKALGVEDKSGDEQEQEGYKVLFTYMLPVFIIVSFCTVILYSMLNHFRFLVNFSKDFLGSEKASVLCLAFLFSVFIEFALFVGVWKLLGSLPKKSE